MAATRRQRRGLQGVSKLRKQLRRLPDDVTAEVREAIADSAEMMRFEQLKRVPVDEGDLAASIEIKLGRDKMSADIGPGARTKKAKRRGGWRARFIEFGTRYISARPFVGPAFDAGKDRATQWIDRAVTRALKRAGR
ncbi:HK97-gp10 family putative phage morphogenesis protein [Pyruvatibacter mobilis]|uniref:HK97-gp10 family putative phage morphogenesis protein n=1 Tax=Pyruvatibacter mobilis TaxID=1712261 RepID=UPI003BA9B664